MKKKLFCVPGAFAAAAALTIRLSALPAQEGLAAMTYLRTYIFADTLGPACAFILMFMLMYHAPREHSPAPAFACACLFTLGSLFSDGNADISRFARPVLASTLALVFIGAYTLFDALIRWFIKLSERAHGEPVSLNRLMSAGILFACWLPYLLIAFPGTLHGDSFDQLGQFLGTFVDPELGISRTAAVSTLRSESVLINDCQPVVYTLALGGIYRLLALLKLERLTAFAAGLLQLSAAALALARALALLAKLGLNKRVSRLLTAFFALFPMFPMYFACTMKDSVFALCLLAALTFLIEIYVFPNETLARKSRAAGGAIAILLTGLMRSFGIYVLLLTLPALFIHLRSTDRHVIKRAVASILVPVILCFGVTYAIYPLCKVGKGPESESMSYMFQATALYVKEYPDEVTEHEKAVIDGVLGYDSLADRYVGNKADTVKNGVLGRTPDYDAYRQLWLEMLAKHPGVYLRAFAALSADYWAADELAVNRSFLTYLGTDFGESHAEYKDILPLETSPALLRLCNLAITAIRAIGTLPVISLLYGSPVYLFSLIFSLVLLKKRRAGGRGFVWALIIYALCLGLGPVSGSTRYAFPLILCAPLSLGFACASVQKTK